MNRLFKGICCILLILCAGCVKAVYVKVADSSAQPSGKVELPVSIKGIKGIDIIAADLAVKYDPQVLSLTAVNKGAVIVRDWPGPIYKDNDGLAHIVIYHVKPIKEEGVLLSLVFTINAAAKPGNSIVFLQKVKFNDGKVTVRTRHGAVNITPMAR